MRVLVCGSRDWTDYGMIDRVLNGFAQNSPTPITVVHGAAKGADSLAGLWARNNGCTEEPHPADWRGQGKMAGPLRNKLMLDTGVDRVLAFKDGFSLSMRHGGTEHMVSIAIAAGVITTARGHDGFYLWRLALDAGFDVGMECIAHESWMLPDSEIASLDGRAEQALIMEFRK